MVGSLSLLVGTRNGLLKFQSEDKGETWRPTDNVETNRSVQLVVADRNDTSTAYGVSYSGLVFASYDGGLTWKEMPPKLGCRMVHSIYPIALNTVRGQLQYGEDCRKGESKDFG